jgi:D-tagatose-1,6-bisphosphate aldolase subunit GatZ/KbaZ
VKAIQEIIAQHKAGRSVGIYAACSAHPLVIEAALITRCGAPPRS